MTAAQADKILPLLVLAVGAFAAAWVEGWTGLLLWLLGVTSAFIAHQARRELS